MTDLETFTAMLDRAGAPYRTEQVEPIAGGVVIVLEPGDGVVSGYNGFEAVFEFGEEGALRKIGIWE